MYYFKYRSYRTGVSCYCKLSEYGWQINVFIGKNIPCGELFVDKGLFLKIDDEKTKNDVILLLTKLKLKSKCPNNVLQVLK